MKLLTEFLPHLLLYSFVGVVLLFCFALLSSMLGFVLIPISILTDTQCPECKGFLKRKLIDSEVVEEKEFFRIVERVDQGILRSKYLLEPDQVIEINRTEQVTFVEQRIVKSWGCKNPLCGHVWKREEASEFEGSLGDVR